MQRSAMRPGARLCLLGVLSVVAASLLSGCGGGGDGSSGSSTTSYWPLAVGNTWEYVWTVYDLSTAGSSAVGAAAPSRTALGFDTECGCRPSGVATEQGTFTVRLSVVSRKDVDGVSWFELSEVIYSDGSVAGELTYLLRDGADGVWKANEHGSSATLVIPASPQVGDTWGYTVEYPAGNRTYSCRIGSLEASVEVPAGTYRDCLRREWEYRYSDGSLGGKEHHFFSPGVGLVCKEGYNAALDAVDSTWTLTAAHVQ